ncbi:MAG TPA: hypothetical protein VGJ92_03415 [Methanocella sp.]|jgi:hypothetical protein
MCDGIFGLKMYFIQELIDRESPEESQDYVQKHLTWTLEELKAYRDGLARPGYDKNKNPMVS